MKNGDFPVRYVNLPEGISHNLAVASPKSLLAGMDNLDN